MREMNEEGSAGASSIAKLARSMGIPLYEEIDAWESLQHLFKIMPAEITGNINIQYIHTSTCTRPECGYVSLHTSTRETVPELLIRDINLLPLTTVQECIDNHMKEEIIEKACDRCTVSGRNNKKQLFFKETQDTIIIMLKRYTQEVSFNLVSDCFVCTHFPYA